MFGDGLSQSQITTRVARRQLLRLYPAVYAVGHTELPAAGRPLAAAWSAGTRGLLFDVAAAQLHGVRESDAAVWDVALPQSKRWTAPPGIRAHAVATLRPEDVTILDGVPVTTLARTVVDLAARHPTRVVEKVLDEMVVLQRYAQRALDALLARPYLRGTRQLREILKRHTPGTTITRTELEELLLELSASASADPRPTPGSPGSTWTPGGRARASSSSSTRRAFTPTDARSSATARRATTSSTRATCCCASPGAS